ncbi:MAG: hypothetical protein FD174_1535 [Geobacteraceae bacterium]|nr:MAG: hypothetical protein FD174_1535 [Geobacteraceae bacterium]
MGITAMIIMWVATAIALAMINNDRYGKEVTQRETFWNRFR